MGFQLHKVETDSEFGPLIAAFREGFSVPDSALRRLFMGDWRPHDAVAQQAALEESTARMRDWHRADPTSTWLKVVDEESGDVVAGGRWCIHEPGRGNPYDEFEAVEATWFPEGEARRVASLLMGQFLGSAVRNANRPHVYLNILFTVPKYRRRGAASMIMDWGVTRAETLGLGVYIEATEAGRPVYEQYGLRVIEEHEFEVRDENLPAVEDGELRREVVRQLTPFRWWSMVKEAT
ncbi:hypothetical protein CTRI78_v004771 [Colletotrichum trifolii]|uniref:N-acetyltransferase domain-containing protein n=1 Tax=Colletotrichum trifolii TaxID=5466 RepID=A0A4R8RGB7_COLTR|nr:hypothetical protein CTRI78_v004771 [Colletotrichum trifolii]